LIGEIVTERLLLKPMTVADAEVVSTVYSDPQMKPYFSIEPLLTQLQKVQFTERIINSSNYIWTIRLLAEPKQVIGDCALHHINEEYKTIEIGGTLLPACWGKGLMAEAFTAVIHFATCSLHMKYIIGKTNANNTPAIRCVQKLGFQITNTTPNEVQLMKKV
jgi:[ribosomal protein S5]-alanine N-acetyltransferase